MAKRERAAAKPPFTADELGEMGRKKLRELCTQYKLGSYKDAKLWNSAFKMREALKNKFGLEGSSDDGDSSGDESVSGVWELDVEELRGRLAAQPKLTPEPEIEDAKASMADKEPRPARDAISANGCCQCFTVHMCLAVFVVATAGVLLAAVGTGTAPSLTPADVFGKYQGVEECVALRNGDLIPISKWSGDLDLLCKFSREKMEARMDKAKTKELELEPEPEEPESSGEEEGEFECRKNCGRCFKTPKSRGAHEGQCSGPIELNESEVAAARAFLDGLDSRLSQQEVVDAADGGGVNGVTVRSGNAEILVDKVHGEVAELAATALASKLRAVGVTLGAGATPAQRRATYVLARVEQLVKPVLLARTYFWENGEFQLSQCEAYVRGLSKGKYRHKNDRLKKMIKGVKGASSLPRTLTGLSALEAALIEAYQAQTPEVAEEAKYNPFAAPKIEELISKHGEKLCGGADDDVVIEAVAKTASGLLQQTKGGFLATNGSVIYVHTLWLLRLIVDGRTTVRTCGDKIFEDFKADNKGKREGYFEADDWLSAVRLKAAQRMAYNHSAPFDEAHHTLGEIVYGGNLTDGKVIVCFIVEDRKFFVLFQGREDYVLVNEVTMACLAFVAATVVPIVLAETGQGKGQAGYGALSSGDLPRLKDILASVDGEQKNRIGFRGKWKAMTRFFDGFFALVLSAILDKGGTITEAPAALSKAADEGVPKQGPIGSSDGPKDGFSFDEKQVGNLILRLRGGGGGMCGGRDTGGGYGPDSDDDGGGGGPTGTGSSGGGGAKKKKQRTGGTMGADMGSGWTEEDFLDGGN